jgi:inward rectifier potassium channel
MGDLYHYLIRVSWWKLVLLLSGVFLLVNIFFAALFLLFPNSLYNVASDDFLAAFFFSVHTFTTIGYGNVYPINNYGNFLVTIESFLGVTSVAMMTGLMFAKFSVPKALIEFTDKMVIAERNGERLLMFRLINKRTNRLVDGKISVVFMRDETTKEGELFRKMHDLKVNRNHSPFFALSWTVSHPLDEESPLFKDTIEDLQKNEAMVFVSVTGIDETTGQTIHSQKIYLHSDIVFNKRFKDILKFNDLGERVIDYSDFNTIVDSYPSAVMSGN